MSGTMTSPLRFGILCNGTSLAKWQAAAVRALIESGNGAPALLIVDDRPRSKSSTTSRLRRLVTEPGQLWRLYSGLNEPAALRPEDMSAELAGVPELRCRVVTQGKYAQYFLPEDVERIRSYDLDFILRFGFGILKGDVLNGARYGVWSFHHGDEAKYRGGPPGFWEIAKDDPITGVIFQRLTDRLDAGVVLRRGYFKTLNYSYARNFNRILMEAADWPAAVAGSIRAGALDVDVIRPSTSNAPVYRAPSNTEMLKYFGSLARNIGRRLFERTLRDEWNVGVVRLAPADAIRGGTLSGVRWHPPFEGGWIADPMARAVDGKVQVLVERMRLDTDKGYIAALTFDGTSWDGQRLAIDTHCHASYPYLFSYAGDVYCVPETYEANEVRLYKCVDFPNTWELAGTLLRGIDAVDSTIFEYDGRWWLICTTADASAHRLQIFHAPTPLGGWEPHARNPVKVDVRSSRPAGPPFWVEGTLYRPAQDSSRTYGGRIAVNRIDTLTPVDFEEETVAYLEPEREGRYTEALHTLCFAGDYAVVDGKRWRWKRSRT